MKALADTCVILDVLQKREPFWEEQRITHSDTETGKIMKKVFLLFPVLNTTGLDCQRALISETADYEDAIMVETALRENADCIITRNISDYKFSPVPVYTPSDFLNITKRQ